jgi:L-fucose dehydrogenase
MDLQLNGKVILVTGGAKGIGVAIVRECAKEGAIPVIVDKDAETGKAVQGELRQAGMACEFVAAELRVAKA